MFFQSIKVVTIFCLFSLGSCFADMGATLGREEYSVPRIKNATRASLFSRRVQHACNRANIKAMVCLGLGILIGSCFQERLKRA